MKLFSVILPIAILQISLALADDDTFRLPTTVIPSNYVVDLVVPAVTDNVDIFTGTVVIDLEILEPVSSIKLHSKSSTNIKSVSLTQNSSPVANITPSFNETFDILTISSTTVTSLENGSYVLTIDFSTTLRDDMFGFYKSSYVENNVTQYILSTQFESTHARQAFPCFDEPSFKANFTVSLTVPNTFTTLLSNTEIANTTAVDDKNNKIVFETTPIMSTYLVAFIVSNFQCSVNQENDKFRVCSRNDFISSAQEATNLSYTIMHNLEDITNLPYLDNGIPKMDLAAIPDFNAGAMENWGLVTYREKYLLYDNETSSNKDLQNIATVIAHEFTHQWFGDLVTLDFWNNAFLNEGFAAYFEYFSLIDLYPEWELENYMVVNVLQSVLKVDAAPDSLAISSPVNSLDDIELKFDDITYDKGSSVIRMIKYVLGDDLFITNLRTYLTTLKYKNAGTDDLFNAWNISANLPDNTNFINLAKSWFLNPGFPVVNVTLSGSDVILTQQRLLLNGTDSADPVWYVPITCSTSESDFKQTAPSHILQQKTPLTISNVINSDGWIIVNNQQTGFYRVNYDSDLWRRITLALLKPNFDGIHVLNRAQLISDAFNLAKAGLVSYNTTLELVTYLSNEVEYAPWFTAINEFSFILDRVAANSDAKTSLTNFFLDISANLTKNVSFQNEKPLDHVFSLKQAVALSILCKLEQDSCVSESSKRFDDFKNSSNISKDLRGVIYCSALRSSSKSEDFDFLWSRYDSEISATEKVTIGIALGCTKNTSLVNKYLQEILNTPSKIRKQDAATVFSSLLDGNGENTDAVLNFFISNYTNLNNYITSANLNDILSNLISKLTTHDQIANVTSFLDNVKDNDSLFKAGQQALTKAQINLEWDAANIDLLKEIFDSYSSKSSSTTPTATTTTTTKKPETSTSGTEFVQPSNVFMFVMVLVQTIILMH